MRLPKYRRRPDRNTAFVEYKGQRHPFPGQYDSAESRAAYHQFIARILAATPDELPTASGLVIEDLALAYLGFAGQRYRSNGKPNDEYAGVRLALTPLLRLYASKPAIEFGPLALKAVRQSMIAGDWRRPTDNVKQEWSRGFINQQVARIRRMFRWGVAHELIPPAILAALEALPPLRQGQGGTERPPIQPVDPGHVAAVLPFLPRPVRPMVELQQLTGMRSDNLCTIRPADVDQADDIWLYRPETHKTAHRGRGLIVPIGPQGQAILTPWLDRPADDYCFTPAESQRHRAKRARYDARTYRHAVVRAIERANKDRPIDNQIPHWTPHQLRHAVATTVRERWDIQAAQAYLGHAHPRTTEIYAERDLAQAVVIAREIG